MADAKNAVKSFTDSELREAVRFCEELIANKQAVTGEKFQQHFRCNRERAWMLKRAAEFAVKIKAKGI